mmetsp:Transcript_2794/g.10979  ORF Transcript_2794/g.10979 Transcript_2794/m.10979 type:complete len:214 (-) Transcript_2794:951-1592(-)
MWALWPGGGSPGSGMPVQLRRLPAGQERRQKTAHQNLDLPDPAPGHPVAHPGEHRVCSRSLRRSTPRRGRRHSSRAPRTTADRTNPTDRTVRLIVENVREEPTNHPRHRACLEQVHHDSRRRVNRHPHVCGALRRHRDDHRQLHDQPQVDVNLHHVHRSTPRGRRRGCRGGGDRVSGANRLRHRSRRLVRIVRVESRRYNRRRLRLYGREHRV